MFNRTVGFVASFALLFLSSQNSVAGEYYQPVPNAPILVEHLVKHADALLTEINLTRASRNFVSRTVYQEIHHAGGWAGQFMSQVLIVEDHAQVPDYIVGKLAYIFRVEATKLYDRWWRYRGPSPDFQQQFIQTDYAYHNAIAATLFYIECLRRSYLIQGAAPPNIERQLLVSRLVKMERLVWEIRNLMLTIRTAQLFAIPQRRNCVETTFMHARINVAAPGPNAFVPFPYYHENRFWGATATNAVPFDGQRPYDVNQWNQYWNQVDTGYVDGSQGPQQLPAGQPGHGPQPGPGQLPAGQPGQPGYGPEQLPVGQQPGQPGYGPEQGQEYGPQPLPGGQQGPGYGPQNGPGQQPGYDNGPGNQQGPGNQAPGNQGNRQPLPDRQIPQPQVQDPGEVAPTNDFDYTK